MIKIILPAIITIIGNIIFYLFVKNNVDKKIETFKISYSGVYKEKIEVHKNILKYIYELKTKVYNSQYIFSTEYNLSYYDELRKDINEFIAYYQINKPFIKTSIFNDIIRFREELQYCLDSVSIYNSVISAGGNILEEAVEKNKISINKLRNNEPFKSIEDKIITEMKKDLKID